MVITLADEAIITKEVIHESKHICLDLDGTICKYDFPKIVKNFFGVSIEKYSIFAYDLADVLGVSRIMINTMFREQVFGKPIFIEGALETIRGWKEKDYDLAIYTSRIKYMGFYDLARWLIEYQIPFSRISNGGDVFDVHIDDSPGKLMSTNSKIKLLFNQPWNERCLNITGELKRVFNWNQIKKEVG